MTKFILNKLTTLFILFGGFSGMCEGPLAQVIYCLWLGAAGAWAALNALALIDSLRKDSKKQHLKAIQGSDFQLYNAERAIILTVLAIVCFLVEEQIVMGIVYLLTVLPYTFIMYKYTKILEQKRQKRYNK